MKEEQFLKLEAVRCLSKRILILRKVNLAEGKRERNKTLFLQDIIRKGFREGGKDAVQSGCHKL